MNEVSTKKPKKIEDLAAGDGASESQAVSGALPVRSPRVEAGACPRSAAHSRTRVYRTVGQTRYCVCDDCGTTFKRIGPEATLPVAAAAE